jgi:chromosome segregation ATPase
LVALLASNPSGETQQTLAEMHVTNASVAAQLETVSKERDVAQATLGALQLDKRNLTTRAEDAEASVRTLTADKAQMTIQLEAAMKNYDQAIKDFAHLNTGLSKQCLAHDCLTNLKDAAGNPLAKDATAEQKLEAANRIPWQERLAADNGAINSVLTKLGVSVSSLPSQPGTGTAQAARQISRAEFEQLDPKAQTAFFKHGGKLV